MDFEQLPLRLMDCCQAEVSENRFEFMKEFGVPERIRQKYFGIEDIADAFEGAFVAVQIIGEITLLKEGHYEEAVRKSLDDILGWYDFNEKDNLNGAFYFGIGLMFSSVGFHNFYMRAREYIQTELKLRKIA